MGLAYLWYNLFARGSSLYLSKDVPVIRTCTWQTLIFFLLVLFH